MSETAVRVTRRFAAPPERVFDGWVIPAIASKYLFATPTGQIIRCDMDARPGGRYVITDRRGTEDVEHTGEYKAVDRPTLLVFTLQVPKYSDTTTTVTIHIAARDGGCELTLISEPVPPEYVAQTDEGWRAILEALAGLIRT